MKPAIVVMGKITLQQVFGFIITIKYVALNHIMFKNAVKSFNVRILLRGGNVREFLLDFWALQKITYGMSYKLATVIIA